MVCFNPLEPGWRRIGWIEKYVATNLNSRRKNFYWIFQNYEEVMTCSVTKSFQWQSPTSFSSSSISFKRVLPSFFREKGTNVEELAFSFSLSLSQLKMCDTNFLCQRDSKRVEWNDKSFSFFSVSSILGSFKFVTDLKPLCFSFLFSEEFNFETHATLTSTHHTRKKRSITSLRNRLCIHPTNPLTWLLVIGWNLQMRLTLSSI